MRRRTTLQALASLPFAVPLLDIARESRAASAEAKRLILMNTPNGLINEQLFPESGLFERGEKNFGSGENEVDLAAGYTLASLADMQSDLLLVTGLDFPGVEEHAFHPIMAGTHSKKEAKGFDTIDQVVASLVGGSTPLSSINLGVPENSGAKAGRVDSASSRDGRPIPFHQTPQDAFEALFENFAPEADAEVDPQVEDRRKVLDLMHGRLKSLQSGLGSADARRIEWHMDAVSDLERSLTAIGPSAGCMPPDVGAVGNDTPAITDFMIKLTVQGLACGMTNVVNFSFGGSAADSVYSWLSDAWPSTNGNSSDGSASAINESHHAISHNAGVSGTRDRRKGGKKAAIDRWHAEQFGALLRALKAVEMPGGETLFDSTTSIWMGENRDGTHTRHDMHFLVGGGIGTGFRMGRILRLSDKPRTDWNGEHPDGYNGTFGNNFWLTLLRSFGSDAASFGDADWVSGEIPELLT